MEPDETPVSSFVDNLGKLAKGAGIIFCGIVLGRALGLLGHIWIARALNPRKFGEIMLAYTIVATLGTFAVLGIPQGVTRLIAATENEAQHRDLLRSGYLLASFGGILGATLIFAFRSEISVIMGISKMTQLLSGLLAYLLILPILQVTLAGLRGLKLSKETVLSRDLVGKIVALGLFAFFFLLGEPYIGAIGYLLAIPTISAVASVYLLNKYLPIGPVLSQTPTRTSLSKLVSFSWPLALEGGFVGLMATTDLLLIGFFLQATQVGWYKAIQPLTQVILMILSSLVFLYLPIATEYYEDENYSDLSTIFTLSTKWVVILSFPLLLTFVMFSEDVIRVFFSENYTPASLAFIILSIGVFLRVFVGPNGATIKAIDRTKIDLIASISGVSTNLILNVLLIPRWGIEGAAIATSIGFVVFNFVDLVVIYRSIGIHPFSMDAIKPIILTSLFAIIPYLVFYNSHMGLVALLLIGVLLTVINLISVVLTQSLDSTDVFLIDATEEMIGVDLSLLKRAIQLQVD